MDFVVFQHASKRQRQKEVPCNSFLVKFEQGNVGWKTIMLKLRISEMNNNYFE